MVLQYVTAILTAILKKVGTSRLLILLAIPSIILGYALFKDKWCYDGDCRPTFAYVRDKALKGLHLSFGDDRKFPSNWNGSRIDGTIVLAHTKDEDISWINDYFPHTPAKDGELKVPRNKGREAMAYLTYIVDHYDVLPEMMLFIHAHRDGYRKAWHVDAPLHDQVIEISSLNLDIIREQGYHNLRCSWRPGCGETAFEFVNREMWNGIFRDTSTPPGWLALQSLTIEPVPMTKNLTDPESESFLIEKVPKIETTCCAQFGIIRKVIHRRPREDYLAFRKWLLETPLNDVDSGTTFEYLWHIIFGELAQNCPDQEICYCALYGRC